jgi:ribonuclease P protein subunit POP4
MHAGHPEIKKRVREEMEVKARERDADGVEGVRQVRRKLKERDTAGVLGSGMDISYVPVSGVTESSHRLC